MFAKILIGIVGIMTLVSTGGYMLLKHDAKPPALLVPPDPIHSATSLTPPPVVATNTQADLTEKSQTIVAEPVVSKTPPLATTTIVVQKPKVSVIKRPPTIEELLTKGGSLPWQTYTNKKFGFAFAYPPEWEIGRDLESIYQDIPNQNVDVDSGVSEALFGNQGISMQVQLRNPNKLPILELVRSFGSPRQYVPYSAIAGVPAIVYTPPGGHGATINFTSGNYFFNIDVRNIDAEKLRKILDTFAIAASSSDTVNLKPALIPSSPISLSAAPCTLTPVKKSQAKGIETWHTFIDQKHCLGFMYPSSWTRGDVGEFSPPPMIQQDTEPLYLFKHNTEIGKEILVLNVIANNPNSLSAQDLLQSLRTRGEHKAYGTIAGVDAMITTAGDSAIIRFTKGTYLFELYTRGISPETFRSIADTFVIFLPEPTPSQHVSPATPTTTTTPVLPPVITPLVSPVPAPLPPPPGRFVIPEDAGKLNVEHLPEVEALRQKYGEERLFIKALDRHLIGHEAEWHTNHAAMKEHDELLYAVRPDWDPKITGCVIVVYAAGEGFVYQEDKALKVIGRETLGEFFKHTENVPPEMMYRFFLSLH